MAVTYLRNRIRNPSAELGVADMSALGFAGATVVSAPAQVAGGVAGEFCAEVTFNLVSGGAGQLYNAANPNRYVTVTPGDRISGGVSFQVVDGSEFVRDVRMDIGFYRANGTFLGQPFATVIPTVDGQWYRSELENVLVPAEAAFAYFVVNTTGKATGAVTVRADAWIAVDGPTVPDYFDGDSPGASWMEAPHASVSQLAIGEPDPEPIPEPGDIPSPEWPTTPVATRQASYWTFVLCDQFGNSVRELDTATGRKLSFTRNGAAVVTFGLDLLEQGAKDLQGILPNGIPRLKCYREDELRFYGFWTPQREQVGGDGDEGASVTFKSPFARLEQVYTGAVEGSRTDDAGELAWWLIDTFTGWGANVGGRGLGYARGVIEPTVDRERTYQSTQLAEAIVNLTNVQGGFDFSETFVDDQADDVLALFNVHASLGQDRSEVVVFEHGEGTLENVLGVTREIRYPVNFVRVLGEDGLYSDLFDQPSVDRYGLYQVVEQASAGTVTQATLDARAAELLRPELVRVVEFTPDPDLAPQPFEDYGLGDTVTVRAREGSLELDEQVRVNGFEISLDDEGNEAGHTLVFEQQGV